jgi:hypothetical protein
VKKSRLPTLATAGLVAALAALGASGTAAARAVDTGPNTDNPPYVLPVADGVHITSLLTVDDGGSADNGYELVGLPDGTGAYAFHGDVRLFMNHELENTQGITRRHGEPGAFVSAWVIDPATGDVVRGSDLIDPSVRYWDYLTGGYASEPNGAGTQPDGDVFAGWSAAFSRFCSASLTKHSQLYNEDSGSGYRGQIYFANEEAGDEGRTFGVTTRGDAVQLPRLGLASWENTLAAYNQTDTTLTVGNEDAATGQLRLHVGHKGDVGSPLRKAGLTNGTNYVVDLVEEAVATDAEFRTTYGKGQPVAFDVSPVDWNQSGADQNAEAAAEGLTLNRIEDGAWDPRHPNDYYFDTTEGAPFTGRDGGGLWRLSFKNIERPAMGGTLELLLDGSEAPFLNKPDNITIDRRGNLLIQEDPGATDHLARIVAYRISDGARGVIAQFDPSLFMPGTPGYITNDEESSGIITTARLFGPDTFLFDAQVHAPTVNNVEEFVQRGQLLTMHVSDWDSVYGR